MEINWILVKGRERRRCETCHREIQKHECRWWRKEFVEFIDRWIHHYVCQTCGEWAIPSHQKQPLPVEVQQKLSL